MYSVENKKTGAQEQGGETKMRLWKITWGVVEYLGLLRFNMLAFFVGAFVLPFSLYFGGKLIELIEKNISFLLGGNILSPLGYYIEKSGEFLANFVYGLKISSGDITIYNPLVIPVSILKSWFVGITFFIIMVFLLDTIFPQRFNELLFKIKYIEFMRAKLKGDIEKVRKLKREIAELELRYNYNTRGI